MRNQESRFAMNPTRIDMSRSRFDRHSTHKTSFNAGDIIPFYVDEVLPGDTFNVKTSKIVRMQPLATPIMDNIYLDTYFFYVPNRLVWEHWREFMGENTESPWAPETEYEVPTVKSPINGWQTGTIADYMGVPVGVSNLYVNALPFRAYSLICNEWFRDENLTNPLLTHVDDATLHGANYGYEDTLDFACRGGLPFRAAKFHDYFTSALPAPQKGPDVTIPLVEDTSFPVFATTRAQFNVRNYPQDAFVQNDLLAPIIYGANKIDGLTVDKMLVEGTFGTLDSSVPSTNYMKNYAGYEQYHTAINNEIEHSAEYLMTPINLRAYIDNEVAMASINQLRMAFQIQKFYERNARGGTRYIELLKSHFGVTSPDARLQRPEYLGGNRVNINISQVLQQSETGSTPQGTPTGFSMTTDSHSDFTKSFVEHGFVIGVLVARYDHTYQDGLERFWSRKDKFDFYWPVFANIGEQPIKNKEIYASGTEEDDEVFGYQEAWADYRYKPSRVSGEMRSKYSLSLDVWHLGDDYGDLPYLSDDWIREDPSNIDRALAVSSRVSNQFFADIYVRNRCTRAMPLYSIPGLIDHH